MKRQNMEDEAQELYLKAWSIVNSSGHSRGEILMWRLVIISCVLALVMVIVSLDV